ncbi:MAG: phosphoribosylaminoimidazolesuccinocarboxamide synthase [Deltaproteobacteria bacterium]|nr:MAG: phosphoribosylaminoimidazolesuccinocarboxamide synthase [Deltaproteobacteria bacterium]
MSTEILRESNLEGIQLLKRGKVRDIYEVEDMLLIVASDRISAYDVVMDDPIPDKGRILTQMSLFWFEKVAHIIPNHVVSYDPKDYPSVCQPYANQLKGRSMLVKKAEPLPVECIVRGYLAGSGWKEYLEKGSVCGIDLPPDLKESQELPEALFTPSTKAEGGIHDENIPFEKAAELLGQEIAEKVKAYSLAIYEFGRAYARERGIIIADTKFEFGIHDGQLILIDEVLTPDSSRFWPAEEYEPGRPQRSFDKQFLRDYLTEIGWGKQPPPPKLPQEIIDKTREKYLDALRMLTGQQLD